MSREDALRALLGTSASLQWNLAIILEAKAVEAEKARAWLCHTVTADMYESHEDQVKGCGLLHDGVLEMIDGIAKLGEGLNGTLKAVLRQEQEAGGLGAMFGGGFSFDQS